MPDRVQVDQKSGIIDVVSYGLITEEDIKASFEEIERIRQQTGINRILVDTTGQASLPETMTLFALFSSFPAHFKVALLLSQRGATEKDLHFIETICSNRGIPMRVFFQELQARQWLKRGDAT